MIQEWLWAAAATTSPAARALGYPRNLALYMARAKRNATSWDPHLKKTRDCILRAAHAAGDRELAIIAGSGSCLDIPIEELAALFERVVLLDVVHPRPIIKMAARLSNVHCLLGDLTGVLNGVVERVRSPKPLPLPKPACDLCHDRHPGLVVSANTLAQLPLLPIERLWSTGRYTDDELETFAYGILAAHLAWLQAFHGVRCLITDLYWLREGAGQTLFSDPLYGLQFSNVASETWEWRVAPKPEAHPVCDLVHVVAGMRWPSGE